MKVERQSLKHLEKLRTALNNAQDEIMSLYRMGLPLVDAFDNRLYLEYWDNKLGELRRSVESQIYAKKVELEV